MGKIKASNTSGAGADDVYKPTMFLFNRFIVPHILHRKGKGNLNDSTASSSCTQHDTQALDTEFTQSQMVFDEAMNEEDIQLFPVSPVYTELPVEDGSKTDSPVISDIATTTTSKSNEPRQAIKRNMSVQADDFSKEARQAVEKLPKDVPSTNEVTELLGPEGCKVLKEPKRVWNCDETSFFLAPKGGLILAPKGEHVYDISENSKKENITTLFADVVKNAPDDWSLDGHRSPLTLHLSTLCRDNGIIVVALEPNTTHTLQPLDVAAFFTLKQCWLKYVRKWRIDHDGEEKTKFNLPSALRDILINDPHFADNVRARFKTCDLYPFDANQKDFTGFAQRFPTNIQQWIATNTDMEHEPVAMNAALTEKNKENRELTEEPADKDFFNFK
ncbi:hypothetical protein CBL_10570 [Carabus blaptoides fortunei]